MILSRALSDNRQKGIAAVELVLIIVIVGIISATGYFVYQSNKKTNDTIDTAAKAAQSKPEFASKQKTDDGTGGWIAYSSQKGQFSLKYPAAWVQPENQEACGDFLSRSVHIGPNQASVIKCATDGTASQVSVTSVAGDKRSDTSNVLSASEYDNIKTKTVKVNGVSGAETSGTAAHQQDNFGVGGLPDGAMVVQDVFYTNGNTYIARYTQYPPSQSILNTDQKSTYVKIIGTLNFR